MSPLRASDLSGVPPAVIIVGALDPLRDEAIRYAERLGEAGVHVDLRVVPRMFHGFWLAPGVLPKQVRPWTSLRRSCGECRTWADAGLSNIDRRKSPMAIRTIEELEGEILGRTGEVLDVAGQDCAQSGHVWKALETTPPTADPLRIVQSVSS